MSIDNEDGDTHQQPSGNLRKERINRYLSCIQTLNHYSGLVLTVRITAMTSGMLILAAAGSLLVKEHPDSAACCFVCIFGIIFSLILWLITMNYYKHYETWLELAIKHEEILELPDKERMWTIYRQKDRADRCPCYTNTVHYGCSIVIIVASIIVIIFVLKAR